MLNRELPFVNAFGTVDIKGCKTIDDALYKSGLDWEVEQKPLYDENGNKYPKYVANVRKDTNSLITVVTNQYQVVQNRVAFDFVNDLVNEGFEFESAGLFNNGNSIWLMGQLPKTSILGDEVTNNLVFVNSHDGSAGVKVMMTPIRLVCANMLNLATHKAQRSWSAKHTISLTSRIEDTKATLGLSGKYMKFLTEFADSMSTIKVSDTTIEGIIDKMFPIDYINDTPRKIENITNFKTEYFQCLDAPDIKQFRGTAWGAINAMTDIVDHSEPLRKTTNVYANNWNKLINGHPVVDKFTREIEKISYVPSF